MFYKHFCLTLWRKTLFSCASTPLISCPTRKLSFTSSFIQTEPRSYMQSLDCVQLKGYFLVTLWSFQMRHYFSLSCLHVFFGLKYPMDMQFGEDRALDKISDMQQSHHRWLWCHLHSGIALHGICSILAVVLLFSGPEHRGAQSFEWEHSFSFTKAGVCLFQAFMENQELRVNVEGRAWSKTVTEWDVVSPCKNSSLSLSVSLCFIINGVQTHLMYFCSNSFMLPVGWRSILPPLL